MGRRAGGRNHGDRDRGGRGAAGVSRSRRKKLDAMKAQIIGVFDGQMDVFSTSARVLDDGVDRPARYPQRALGGAGDLPRGRGRAPPQRMQFSVAPAMSMMKQTPFFQDPDRQIAARSRCGSCAPRAPARLRRGRGLFRRRPRRACMSARADQAVRIGEALPSQSYLRNRRHHRCGKRPPAPARCIPVMAFSPRMRNLRKRCRDAGFGVHRPVAGIDPGDGQQGPAPRTSC